MQEGVECADLLCVASAMLAVRAWLSNKFELIFIAPIVVFISNSLVYAPSAGV